MNYKNKILSLTIAITVLLNGCGSAKKDEDKKEDKVTLAGQAIDGYIKGAVVKIADITTKKTIKTGDGGGWQMYKIKKPKTNAIITIKCNDNDDTCIDQSTDERFDSTTVLKAVISDTESTIMITPLSTLVAEIFETSKTQSLSDIRNIVADNLDISVNTLDSNYITDLVSSKVDAKKAINAIFKIEKISELYNSISTKTNNDSKSGLATIAKHLSVKDTSLKSAINNTLSNIPSQYQNSINIINTQLNTISTVKISINNLKEISKAIEVIILPIKQNFKENNASKAYENAKILSLIGLKEIRKKTKDKSLDVSDYVDSLFKNDTTKRNALILYNKFEDLINNSNLNKNDILNTIALNGDIATVINTFISNSNKPNYDMGTTIDNFVSSINSDPTSTNKSTPSFTSISSSTVDENQINAITLNATDSDGDTLTYSIRGGDSADFDIDSNSGVITFKTTSMPNFENKSSYSFKAYVSDGAYKDVQNITINITDISEAPTITSSNNASVDENQTSAITINATDDDGDSIIYSISGGDSADFDINSTNGIVTFKSTSVPDFEAKTSYDFIAKASDGTLQSTQNITININNLNDNNPIFTSTNSITVNERQTSAIDLNATDADNDNLIYSIESGDSADFDIDSNSGIVTFKTAPDYRIKNSYTFSAKVSDGLHETNQTIIITIRDILETELPLLVIQIDLNDYSIQSSQSVWHDKFFGTNQSQLNHYYQEISYGKFKFIEANETFGTNNDGIVRVSLNIDHPDNDNFTTNYLVDAVNLADGNVDFSLYDFNNDNTISRDELQIMFIVAGGESAYGDNPGVWAHQWCLDGTNANAPTVDGVKVMDCSGDGVYSRFGERQGDHDATVGIIAHELGHAVFKLPDLYDTDDSSSGIGDFGLMSSGSWGFKSGEEAGTTPSHMCAWSKLEQNWLTAQVVTSQNNIALKDTFQRDYNIIKINTNDPKEYFLLENRSTLGYDAGLYRLENKTFNGGIAIWHIDENQKDTDKNDNENHKLVDLEEANDIGLDSKTHTGKATNLFYSTNKTEFGDNTTPNSKNNAGDSTNIYINNISNQDTTMYLDLN